MAHTCGRRIFCQDIGKNLEAGIPECLTYVLHDDWIAQVGLVATVFAQGLGIGDERKLGCHRLAVGEFLEHAADDRLDRIKDILLSDKAHLQIELVELTGRTVGARVLITETRRDLEIAIESRDHDQLLELLGGLRQRVKFSRMQPRWHQVVTGALWR